MKLLDQVEAVGKRRHLSHLTIECYQRWIKAFLQYCADMPGLATAKGDPSSDWDLAAGLSLEEEPPPAEQAGRRAWRHPRELGAAQVQAFLTHLAVDRRLSASSQNQATNAIVFLYKQVLADELPEDHLGRFVAERSRRPARVPTVLSQGEVQAVIEAMPSGTRRLMVRTLYGTGLRVMELCTLRLRDLDFDRGQIIVRGGKGDKDRFVMMPAALRGDLSEQSRAVRHRHERDLAKGGGHVPLPDTLKNKVADPGSTPYIVHCGFVVLNQPLLRADPGSTPYIVHCGFVVLNQPLLERGRPGQPAAKNKTSSVDSAEKPPPFGLGHY